MNIQQIRQWFDIFKNNKELTEIRIIDNNQKRTYSGYFTDVETIIKEIARYDNCNIYFTLNEIDEACYSREQRDRIVTKPKSTTSDKEIVGRDWCLIDIDCEKPSDTNSTDEEKNLAKKVVNNVYKFLSNQGFNKGIVCDSANGYHILLKQEMMNNEANTAIMKNFLGVLDMLFSTDKVKVDTSTFNASRICKLYGCVSRKGADTPSRPQRESFIVKIPDEVKPTPNEYFQKVAAMMPEQEKPNAQNRYNPESFDLDSFISQHSIKVRNTQKTSAFTKHVLEECPFNSSHRAPDSAIFVMSNGAIGFKCLHASCQHYTWQDVRKKFDPAAYNVKSDYDRRFTPYSKQEKKQLKKQDEDCEKGGVWQTLDDIEDEDRSKIVSIPSGIIEYDKKCCGFDKPSLTVWSGGNGSAKSTLLNQVAINAVDKGFTVAVYSGELRAKKIKRWYVRQIAGKSHVRKSNYSDHDYYVPDHISRKITAWMGDRFLNYNTKYSHDIEQVCLEVENLVKKKPVDMLIMDNLSCLDIDDMRGDLNERQKAAVKRVLRLSSELEISVHLVVHPKKSPQWLIKDDISGSKTITDLADCVFIVHRWNLITEKYAKDFLPKHVYEDISISGATNLVECVKHREFGEAESDIYKLYFEPETKRLKNSISEHIVYGWEDSNYTQQTMQPQFDNSMPEVQEPLPPIAPNEAFWTNPENGETCPF